MGKFTKLFPLASMSFCKKEISSKEPEKYFGVCVTNEQNFSTVWKLTMEKLSSNAYLEKWAIEDFFEESGDALIAAVDLWKKLGGK